MQIVFDWYLAFDFVSLWHQLQVGQLTHKRNQTQFSRNKQKPRIEIFFCQACGHNTSNKQDVEQTKTSKHWKN